MLAKRRPPFSGFRELTTLAKIIYLVRLALGSVVMVALLYGIMTLIIGLPQLSVIQQSRNQWQSSVELWSTYEFSDYDMSVYVSGLPELKACDLWSDVTLLVRNGKLVGVKKNSATGESLPIGEPPCTYEAFGVRGLFKAVFESINETDPWRDYVGRFDFNPAFGFVSHVSYYKCNALITSRVFSNDSRASCSDWMSIYVSHFRWYDTPEEPLPSGVAN
jgi:hypothetical protein